MAARRIGAPRRIRITGRRGATSRFRVTIRTRRGRPARWPLTPWAPLPVRRMYSPPYSPLKTLPHSVLQTQSPQIVPPTTMPRAPPQGGHPRAA